MNRQEIINNIGYIADKKAKEYVEQRKSHGVNDPYMLNEIEEAYYEGMVQSENFWHSASERPVIPEGKGSVNIVGYCITPSGICAPMEIAYICRWPDNIKWWCYPPKEK